MEYEIPTVYQDTNPAADLDKKTLNHMVLRSLNLQGSFNYERMQANGWLYSILPGLEKIHTNKDDLSTSMRHNLEFFNTHPFLVTFVMGLVLSMEQNKLDIPTIRAVRVAAMGPLGGIGDALFWFTLVPITAGITSQMALDGNIAGPILFLLIFNVFQFAIRYFLMHWSYKTGVEAIEIMTANATEFTRAASILGVFVVGALTVIYGDTALRGFTIPNGQTEVAVPIVETVSKEQLPSYLDIIFDGNVTPEEALAGTANAEVKPGQADYQFEELPSGNVKVTYHVTQTEEVNINIQEIIDGVLPKLIPLAITLMLYYLMAFKGWTPIQCIGLLLAIGLLGAGPFGWWKNLWG